MSTEGRQTALRDWVEAKRASIAPPKNDVDPESDPALQGIPRVGDEILGGKYVVENVLGIGGMGVVCSAMHKQLKQRVAVKFLAAQMRSPELVDRFIREGQAAVRIKSEHIAPVLDVGVLENGTPYLMMEHLSGADLGDYLTERHRLPIEEGVDFVLQALDALAVAHSAGIVHRDLKPSNLFVTQRSDGSPLVKVLDFGISKITEAGPSPTATLTRPGMMLGSPRYMSPEQLRNASNVDNRADIWAMGVVLQELLSGQPPFDADTFTGLCTMIVSEPPTRLRALVPAAPLELEEIILKCLERKPDERYQNVAELAQALAPFAPEESRFIATRVAKILGHVPNKTPPGGYSSAKLAVGASTPGSDPSSSKKQIDKTQPLPSTTPDPRTSVPSPMATTDPRNSAAPVSSPTDPNAAALAISTAEAMPPKSNAKTFAIVGVAVIALAAVGFVATRKNEQPASKPTPSTSEAPVVVAAPAPMPAPVPVPVVTAAVEPVVSVAAPAVSSAPVAPVPLVPVVVDTRRPRPVVTTTPKPSAAPPPPPKPSAAPPTDEELLNRRR